MKKESKKAKVLQLHRETLRWLNIDQVDYARIVGGAITVSQRCSSDDGCGNPT
jgi:hypothetical protein